MNGTLLLAKTQLGIHFGPQLLLHPAAVLGCCRPPHLSCWQSSSSRVAELQLQFPGHLKAIGCAHLETKGSKGILPENYLLRVQVIFETSQ